ncbi:hypothetical protein, partial [Faecalibaculum rodentium]|uniref:hypothetical protein n=1 Tax=Faecalibaculum rodentium TaxID=1702221 RepID=UPI0025A9429B
MVVEQLYRSLSVVGADCHARLRISDLQPVFFFEEADACQLFVPSRLDFVKTAQAKHTEDAAGCQ